MGADLLTDPEVSDCATSVRRQPMSTFVTFSPPLKTTSCASRKTPSPRSESSAFAFDA
jgi:hypothetical protein